MGYIGSQPATNFETVRKQVSTTNSGTTITLDYSVSSVQDILVTVNAVVQSYDNYSVSGTTLTLGGTLNNDRVEILYVGRTFQTVTPAVGTVTNEMLSGSIANSKLANSSITLNGSAVSLGGSATTPSGGLVYLGGTTFDSTLADVDLDLFSSDYTIHKIYGSLRCDTSGANYHLQWRNGGSDDSSNVYTTSIATNLQLNGSTTNTTDYGGWNLTYMPFVNATINSSGGGAVQPPHFEMTVYNAMNTTYNKSLSFNSMWYRTANQWCNSTGTMYFNDGGSNTFEGVRLFPSSGNFNKGQIKVYGVVDS